MTTLSTTEKKALRGQGQITPSILTIGRKGITDGTLASLNISFRTQSLIKVTLDADREARALLAEELSQKLQAEVISMVGKSCVLYRPQEPA
jgi:RNA-binding protein